MNGPWLRASSRFSACFLVAGFLIGQPSVPGEWVNISVGAVFTLRAPPGTEFRRKQGKDSLTGTLKGPGFALDLDYGLGPKSLPPVTVTPDVSVENVMIDNQPARITFRTPQKGPDPHGGYPVGLEVIQLETPGGSPLRLNLSGRAEGPEQQTVVRKVFTTIRFRRS
jgi:hypothetical protein